MKISFMTLGCPEWDLETICQKGREYGFDGVDFRGLLAEIDVTQLPAFTTGVDETKRKLADAGLEVSGISSSIRVCDRDTRYSCLRILQYSLDTGNGIERCIIVAGYRDCNCGHVGIAGTVMSQVGE